MMMTTATTAANCKYDYAILEDYIWQINAIRINISRN
jgi:hypothetical protein